MCDPRDRTALSEHKKPSSRQALQSQQLQFFPQLQALLWHRAVLAALLAALRRRFGRKRARANCRRQNRKQNFRVTLVQYVAK